MIVRVSRIGSYKIKHCPYFRLTSSIKGAQRETFGKMKTKRTYGSTGASNQCPTANAHMSEISET